MSNPLHPSFAELSSASDARDPQNAREPECWWCGDTRVKSCVVAGCDMYACEKHSKTCAGGCGMVVCKEHFGAIPSKLCGECETLAIQLLSE